MSANAKLLVEMMLQVVPKLRPNIDAVIQDKWIMEKSETWEKLQKLYRHLESATIEFSQDDLNDPDL